MKFSTIAIATILHLSIRFSEGRIGVELEKEKENHKSSSGHSINRRINEGEIRGTNHSESHNLEEKANVNVTEIFQHEDYYSFEGNVDTEPAAVNQTAFANDFEYTSEDNMTVIDNYGKVDSRKTEEVIHDYAGLMALQSAFATRTTRVGGKGGSSFDDSHEAGDFGRISFIEVRAGKYLDYIGISYANGKFIGHGGSGESRHIIRLSENETIVSVSGRSGTVIDQISFTNQVGKTYGPYGGGGGSIFNFDFGEDALRYLFGRSSRFVDQLGFAHFEQLPSPELSTWRSPRYGGNGGGQFDDFQASNGLLGKITEIKVRAGRRVDRLEVCYKDTGCKKHGGNGGRQYSFKLEDDEYVTEIRGRSGSRVDRIQFFLNTGRVSPKYGGGGGRPFVIKKDGHVVSHFFGRSGNELDQIGAFFSEALPTRMIITDIDYDMDTARLLAAEPKAVASFFLINDTSEPQQLKQNAHFKTSETETTSVAETFGTSIELTFTNTFKSMFSESSLSISFGYSYDKTVTTGTSITKEKAQTYHLSTVVGPGKKTRATVVVKEGIFDVKWTATARVFYSNTNDFTEKTIHGVLKGVSVSSIEGKYEDIP